MMGYGETPVGVSGTFTNVTTGCFIGWVGHGSSGAWSYNDGANSTDINEGFNTPQLILLQKLHIYIYF